MQQQQPETTCRQTKQEEMEKSKRKKIKNIFLKKFHQENKIRIKEVNARKWKELVSCTSASRGVVPRDPNT